MSECVCLLDVLVRAERFFNKDVVKKLHELLLKLIGEPLFKYEFAKVFTRYYPVIMNEIIKESSDVMMEKFPSLSIFSVQIFTVPTLTPRLVREVDLLGVLLGCLMELFHSCLGDDGHLQASRWGNLDDTTIRLIEDIRYVLSHEEVPKYIAYERPDILRTWLKLLSIVQGMDAQKRVTGTPIDDENEHLSAPFMLVHFLGNVHSLLVQGAFSVIKGKETKAGFLVLYDSEGQRLTKVGRILQESSGCGVSCRSNGLDCASQHTDVKLEGISDLCVPSSAVSLIFECLKAIDGWLCLEAARKNDSLSFSASSSNVHNMLSFKKNIFRRRKGPHGYKIYRTSVTRQGSDGSQLPASSEHREKFGPVDDDMYPEYTSSRGLSDIVEEETLPESEAFVILNRPDWADIIYDVSSQEISFHIPLHQLLSLLLREAMKICYTDTVKLDKLSIDSSLTSSVNGHVFFGLVFGGLQSYGLSSFLVEHPLRLRVFCAQIRAGMWRINGDAALLSFELYRSVQWFKQGLESDLFLLQCCAALAPPELFVKRIQERFGLLSYTSLNLSEHNEYEAVLVQEMLVLIIQIVKERRFSGLSMIDNLKREIIYKLAVGDATHSQLVKALPRDLSKSDQLQNVLDMLAVYSKPSGMKQGKYSLRKAYWKELDLYHPRWSYRDLQAAEERFSRFCKASALNVQLPRWTQVFDPLKPIAKIATSKAVFHILHAAFFYAAFTEASSVSRAPDGVLITALHLLSLALDICDCHSKISAVNSGSNINFFDHDHQQSVGLPGLEGDLYSILSYALEEFDASAHQSTLCKNHSMISLLVLLRRKYKSVTESSYSDTRHCNIASLIESLLKKFAELSTGCLAILQQSVPEIVCGMIQMSPKVAVQISASTSDVEERRAKARERQAAIMAKMRADQSRFMTSLKSMPENEVDTLTFAEEESSLADYDSEEPPPLCSLCRDPHSQSPLCFLILLQKSRLTTLVERGPVTWQNAHEPGKENPTSRIEGADLTPDGDSSSLVQLIHNADLEFTFNVEPVEVDAILDLFQERLPDTRSSQLSNEAFDAGTDVALSLEAMEGSIYHSIIGDVHDTRSQLDAMDGVQGYSAPCATGSSKRGRNTESSLLGEYVACLSRQSKQNRSTIYRIPRTGNVSSRSNIQASKITGFGPKECDGIHISSCGHAVHQECHDRYLLSLKQRHRRRLGFEGGHIVDPDQGELLCPVCRRFANSILPAFPRVSSKGWRITSVLSSPELNKNPSVLSHTDDSKLHLPLALSLLQRAAKMVGEGRILEVFSGKLSETTNTALEPALQKLYMMYYPRCYHSLSSLGRLSQSLILWDTLRYSLISAEIAARGRVKSSSLSSKSCFESLCAELQSSSGYILSLLLHVAQSMRGLNRLEVLLRFRGLQLLARSICSGISSDNLTKDDKRKGTLSSLIERAENGEAFPDVQFWKQATDPVLTQDPFSSLMWVLFCLPLPFLSSNEIFIALVHLFYAVCIVQAMIACHSKGGFDTSTFGASLLNDVCKRMPGSERVAQYFVSSNFNSNCNPKDRIRRLTFPYLRRCALLWKLLKSSRIAPSYVSPSFRGSSLYMNNDELNGTDYLRLELDRIKELEDMFKICSLEFILKDEVVHALSLRWCDHFCEELRILNYRGVLSCIPAIPFKLVELPRIYQDLLQRYVKLQCTNCNSVPVEPALCLLCGKLCSPSWKSCCRSSICFNHAVACGAGIGVFLLVRKTTILLQRSARLAFWPSPYLDAFGEEDLDLHRGKPLYLSEERYAALTYLVASHGLDRSSEVLRQTTIGPNGLD